MQKSDVKHITKIRYKADGEGFLDFKPKHLWLVPAFDGQPHRLTEADVDDSDPGLVTEPARRSRSLRTAPMAGRRIPSPRSGPFTPTARRSAESSAATVPRSPRRAGHRTVADRVSRQLAGRRWRRVGRRPVGHRRGGRRSGAGDRGARPLHRRCGDERRLRRLGVPSTWSPDGNASCAITAMLSTPTCQAASRTAKPQSRLPPATGGSRRLTLVRTASRSPTSRRTATNPGDLFVADVERRRRAATDTPQRRFSRLGVRSREGAGRVPRKVARRRRSPRVGPEAAWLRGRAEVFPMILEIHGGPHAMYSESLMHEFQLMAARG